MDHSKSEEFCFLNAHTFNFNVKCTRVLKKKIQHQTDAAAAHVSKKLFHIHLTQEFKQSVRMHKIFNLIPLHQSMKIHYRFHQITRDLNRLVKNALSICFLINSSQF